MSLPSRIAFFEQFLFLPPILFLRLVDLTLGPSGFGGAADAFCRGAVVFLAKGLLIRGEGSFSGYSSTFGWSWWMGALILLFFERFFDRCFSFLDHLGFFFEQCDFFSPRT